MNINECKVLMIHCRSHREYKVVVYEIQYVALSTLDLVHLLRLQFSWMNLTARLMASSIRLEDLVGSPSSFSFYTFF